MKADDRWNGFNPRFQNQGELSRNAAHPYSDPSKPNMNADEFKFWPRWNKQNEQNRLSKSQFVILSSIKCSLPGEERTSLCHSLRILCRAGIFSGIHFFLIEIACWWLSWIFFLCTHWVEFLASEISLPEHKIFSSLLHILFSSFQSLSCVQLCDPMDCYTLGLPVHH